MDIALIQVTGVHAIAKQVIKIPAGIIGATVSFVFDGPQWESLGKMAVFQNGDITKDVVLEGNSCTVPAEVVADPGGWLRIGVYGADEENNIAIPTLWAEIGEIRNAADPSGDTSTDETLPVWAQLSQDIKTLTDALADIEVGGAQAITNEELKTLLGW